MTAMGHVCCWVDGMRLHLGTTPVYLPDFIVASQFRHPTATPFLVLSLGVDSS